MIRHILLVQFKAEACEQQLEQVRDLFYSMREKVSGIAGVEWGLNDSPEGLQKNYTHAIVMTFDNEAAREAYLPHPEHDALKAVFVPLIEDIVVFDYSL